MFRYGFVTFLCFYFLVALDDSWAVCQWVTQSYFPRLFQHGSCSSSNISGCGNDYSATASISCSGCSQISVSFNARPSSYPYYCSDIRVNDVRCDYYSGEDRVDYSILRCQTQAEADSVFCVNDGKEWINGQCKDQCTGGKTVACSTFPSGNLTPGTPAYIHRVYILDSCTQTQQLVEEAPGSCAEVGYCKYGQSQCTDYGMGGYLEGSSSSSSPGWSSSSGVECRNIGLIGNTCFFDCNNGAKGYCDGKDGQCDNVDNCSWDVPPQSSESGEGGEGGEGGASSSSPGDSSATSSPSGIDYTNKLNEIIDSIHNTNEAQRAGNAALIGIDEKANKANENLSNINTSIKGLGGKLGAVADASADAAAQVSDTLHNTNSLLDKILGFFLGDSVEYDDDKNFLDSTLSWAEGLQDRFSSGSEIPLDSLQADTSQFKTKFSKMFISNAAIREGCYIFTMKGVKKQGQNSFFFDDVVVDFSKIGGFNFCAIVRGVVKFCAFIICLLITISSYRSAFASTTND